jgi:putative oxidoreductase
MSIFTPGVGHRRALALLRMVAGSLFLLHGSAKLLGFPGGRPPVELFSQMGLAGLLELVGGALVVLGLFTRPVAFVLSGEMAVAYLIAHAPESPFPTVNRGAEAVLFCFLFLYLAFEGAGAWSVDSWLARRRSDATGEPRPARRPRAEPLPELRHEVRLKPL